MSIPAPIDTQPMPFLAEGPSSLNRVAFSGVLLDQIREGLVRFEQDLTLLGCNRPWATLTGLDPHKARGRNLADFLEPQDLVHLRAALTVFHGVPAPEGTTQDSTEQDPSEQDSPDPPQRPQAPPETQNLNIRWRASDGRRVESHTVLFTSWESDEETPKGRLIFNALVHDLTVENLAAEERRNLRERLEQTQENKSLGILAGGLAHDFNNVLTAIIGLVDVAKLQLPDDAPAKSTIQEISKTADYAAILVRNLLSYAGRSKQEHSPVDLSGLVRDLAQWVMANLRPKVELEAHCATGLPLTAGDPEQLRQAVINLVLNAEESFTLDMSSDSQERRRAPRIRMETGVAQVTLAEIQRSVYQDRPEPGTYLFVEVWDNGCGIDPATVNRIFDPFYTSKVTGRGLGLAAVKGVALSHGAFIRVESEVGRGTAIRIYMPVAQDLSSDNVPAPSTPESAEPPVVKILPRGSGNILVVDDEEAVRGIAQATLKMAGYEVTLAEDGQAGWDLVRERPDDFACILLDITMPRMTGDEMLARVREIRPKLPVVLSSGFSANEACFSVTDDPSTIFLKKPYRARHLKQVIADLIAACA